MKQPPSTHRWSRLETACRLVGIWDLAITLPFALPGVNQEVLGLLSALQGVLSPGQPFPEFSLLHLFFVQLFGILAVLWALVRIVRPSASLALWDTLGRFVVAGTMVAYTLQGAGLTVLLFTASEVGLGLLQGVLLLRQTRFPSGADRTRRWPGSD